jgi:ADP-ribosylglycohydrolase
MPGSAPARELPLPNCYWVIPGSLLAGEYPGGASAEDTRERLQLLLDVGIDTFIDLTMPGELEPYDSELPASAEYVRKPIRDHAVPARTEQMAEILEWLDLALRSGRCAYVHCRAGIGRTGTVVGCLLAERGLRGDAALSELNRLWQQSSLARSWPSVPETSDQVAYVRGWQRGLADPELDQRVRPAAPDPLLEQATLSAARPLRERFQGLIVGLAAGDALAASTQFRRAGTFVPVGDVLGGGPFDLPRGAWTDDTAMALCLAESLLESDGFDPHDQVDRYTRWQQQGHLSATGQCVGITASTSHALSRAQWRRQIFSGSHDPEQLDPEVLSRVAPCVAFFFAAPAEAVRMSAEAARTTCQAPAVLDSCRLFAAMLHAALSGEAKEQLLRPDAAFLDPTSLRPTVAELARRAAARGAPAAPHVIESAPEVLEAALWAFRSTANFRDGALRAANLGGNSDVVTTVYGQLAGAHYGVAAIPASWRASLLGRDLLESFADRLLAHAMLGMSG